LDTENVLAEYSTLSDAMKAEYEKLQGDNNVAVETIATLKEELQLAETEITGQIDKIEQLQEELNKIKEEHSSTAITATTLQTDYEKLNEENLALKNSMADFDSQIEALYGELEKNETAIRALQEQNGELLIEMLDLEEATANYEDAGKALLQLQSDKAALERSVVDLIKENEEMLEQMAKLYESEVIETEASVKPAQIEDEVEVEEIESSMVVPSEPEVGEKEIAAPVMAEQEMDSDDVIPDDLKLVEGIGPKIQELLYNSGIKTFQRLSTTPVEHIRRILVLAGDRFAVHDPKTWPEQAKLAAESSWDELKKFQEQLAAEAEKAEGQKS
jgi:predicted flap endonuclease-1-like 5' DNA nuclease/FtsZ-binding cell division protein ZapB